MTSANRLVGGTVVALFVLLTALRVGWMARHPSAISPFGGGDKAPAFTLPLLTGGEFALQPGEVTLIDFWATWCAPCRAELPTIDALHHRYKDRGLRVIAVDTEPLELQPQVAALASALRLTLPIALGGDEVSGLYRVTSLPTLALVGKDGTIARVMVGMHTQDEIARAVEKLLGIP